jgi:hypothetical protein
MQASVFITEVGEGVKERVKNKKWLEKWPKLKVTY